MRQLRKYNELRKVNIQIGYMTNAFSSVLIEFGNTKVICSATIEERLPKWLKGSGKGWITAEYSMLPTSTHSRSERESTKGKVSGRTQEIQRLIGRCLRNCIDLGSLNEVLIKIDCDVISADGGTRTTAINGSWIALSLAIKKLISEKKISLNPIKYGVAAISCGIFKNNILVDLDYNEDSNADADANFVFSHNGEIIEIQCTGEKDIISKKRIL